MLCRPTSNHQTIPEDRASEVARLKKDGVPPIPQEIDREEEPGERAFDDDKRCDTIFTYAHRPHTRVTHRRT
jgi:hypothetical protein